MQLKMMGNLCLCRTVDRSTDDIPIFCAEPKVVFMCIRSIMQWHRNSTSIVEGDIADKSSTDACHRYSNLGNL